jgi:hypothetical protein
MQVAGQILETQLRQSRHPTRLPPHRLHPTAGSGRRPLFWRAPRPSDPVALQQPAHRQPMRAQLHGHLRHQPRLLHDPVDQVRTHVGEAQLGHASGDPLLGVAPPLRCQPLRAGRQRHRQACQRRLYLPVPHPQLGGDPRDAVAGVTAGLQIPAQAPEPQQASAPFLAPIAAAIDPKSTRKEPPARRFCCLWVCPCVAGPAWDREGKGSAPSPSRHHALTCQPQQVVGLGRMDGAASSARSTFAAVGGSARSAGRASLRLRPAG